MADPVDIIAITEALKGDLEGLLVERHEVKRREREIELKISALHQSLSGLLLYADAMDQTDPKLAALVKGIGELLLPSNSSGTLTEACRNALRMGGRKRMSAIEVRKALEGSGFDFSGYTSNPLSSIHTTLRRLKENNEAKEIVIDGTKFYRWIPKPVDPLAQVNIGDLMKNLNFPSVAAIEAQAALAAAFEPSKALSEALATINLNVSDAFKGITVETPTLTEKLTNLFVPGLPAPDPEGGKKK